VVTYEYYSVFPDYLFTERYLASEQLTTIPLQNVNAG